MSLWRRVLHATALLSKQLPPQLLALRWMQDPDSAVLEKLEMHVSARDYALTAAIHDRQSNVGECLDSLS
eukprot:1701006-Amphidinium_carterae.1